ncbi:hypothetical protein K438DRAFT_1965849 [Mycena galopus ATCC 62051]|nr:hypothetical protein K438DRAFT_1965849 [Mycena galopus ATCC 62051]
MALWNYTIPDTSPILSYHPYADGFGLTKGWQTYYTVSGFNTQPGESSQGDSYHLTSLPGAEVSLEFYGTGVYLYGSANASYEVILDNDVQSLPVDSLPGVLYFNEDLSKNSHLVTLRVTNATGTQSVGFKGANVTSSDQKIPTQVFHDNSDSALSYVGNWTTSTVHGIPNSSVTEPFHQTLDAGAAVTMNFSSSVAVGLYASTNLGHELYSVSLDNGAPQVYNGSTFWLVTDTVIFFQAGLDPDRTHTLNVTNMSQDAKLTLSSIFTYEIGLDTSQTGPSPPSNSAGAVGSSPGVSSHSVKVGAIVGPIVGVTILALLSTFLWLRFRKSRANEKTSVTPLILSTQNHGINRALSQMTQTSPRKGQSTWSAPAVPQTSLPPAHHSPPASTASPTSPADVNQIIELIAQRIDRRDGGQGPENNLPPGYRDVDSI